MTIKDHIDKIRRESMGDVDASRATLLLQKLSALLGSVSEEWINAEMAYNRYYESMTDMYEKVSEARAKAKASAEYETKLRAESMVEVTKELLNSMKYTIKLKMQEQQESRYQQ